MYCTSEGLLSQAVDRKGIFQAALVSRNCCFGIAPLWIIFARKETHIFLSWFLPVVLPYWIIKSLRSCHKFWWQIYIWCFKADTTHSASQEDTWNTPFCYEGSQRLSGANYNARKDDMLENTELGVSVWSSLLGIFSSSLYWPRNTSVWGIIRETFVGH